LKCTLSTGGGIKSAAQARLAVAGRSVTVALSVMIDQSDQAK